MLNPDPLNLLSPHLSPCEGTIGEPGSAEPLSRDQLVQIIEQFLNDKYPHLLAAEDPLPPAPTLLRHAHSLPFSWQHTSQTPKSDQISQL